MLVATFPLIQSEGTEDLEVSGSTVLTNKFNSDFDNTALFGHYLFKGGHRIMMGFDFTNFNFFRSEAQGSLINSLCSSEPDPAQCIEDAGLGVEAQRNFYVSWLLGYGFMKAPKEKELPSPSISR